MQPTACPEFYLTKDFPQRWGSLEADIYLAWCNFAQLADKDPQKERDSEFE